MESSETLNWILYISGGFFCGGIMFSRILPKFLLKKDVTKMGKDHNPGAANVFINCGIPMGMTCLLCDMLKGYLPVYLALHSVNSSDMLFSAVIAAPVLGHAIAPMNKGPGGKCISTSFGTLLALLPVTKIVLVLAVIYIFFSIGVKIDPTRVRSIITFSLFGIISVFWLYIKGKYSLSLGCGIISVTAVLKHSKRFSYIPPQSGEEEIKE